MSERDNPMISIDKVKQQGLSWLWPQRLALGKLSMFDGDPGRGKSLVTLDLSARVTTGRPMPDDTGAEEPANVAIVQGEDSAADTVAPRLRALGADLGRVFIFAGDDLCPQEQFSLPSGIDVLARALAINRPRLLIIDPIMAFLDRDIFAYSDQSVRRALTPLAQCVGAHGCACILVRHLNKTATHRSLYRGGGSIGFNAACRSSWLFDFDPDDKNRLIIAQIKNNLAVPQGSLAYRIGPAAGDSSPLEWLGPSPLTAAELLSRAGKKAYKPLLSDQANDFLPAFLDAGPLPTCEIWEAGRAVGLHRRTLQDARVKLGITSTTVWCGGKLLTYWLLPGQKLPAAIMAENPSEDVDDLFADLRAKYPVDPLDDEDAP